MRVWWVELKVGSQEIRQIKKFFFVVFTVRYVRANVDFDHATKVNFSPDTR